MKIVPVRALRDNYVWMLTDSTHQAAWAVDPGEAEPVLAFLQAHQLTLKGILVTHHHADHSGGILDLLSHAPETRVYGAENSPLESLTDRLKDGATVQCGSSAFQAVTIPGHTLDHMAYAGTQALFSGDTLFSAGCGRVFEGTPQMMYASLNRLLALDADLEVYCGHEYTLANLAFAVLVEPYNPAILAKIKRLLFESKSGKTCTLPSTLKEEKEINPFLRCQEAAVIEAAEKHAKKRLPTPVDVFSVLRDWKNHFIATPQGL